jgi:hypothetical protein
MIAARNGRPSRLALLALLGAAVFALASAPAYARVVHHIETSFSGEGTGTLGGDLLAAAVDSSQGASKGDVYVLETKSESGAGSYAVDKLTATGAFTGVRITGAETAPESFEFSPFFSGVAVDSSLSINAGDVYVSDTEHHVVDRFDEDGEFMCQITGSSTEAKDPSAKECDASGSGVTGKITPAGLAVDSSGDVYVANDASGDLDEFGPGGNLLRTITSKGHLSKEMMGIALDSSGDLYVTLFKASVVELDSAGTFQRELGAGAVGVAVNSATTPNQVYVAEQPKPEEHEKPPEPQGLSEYEPSGVLRSFTALSGPSFFPGLAVDTATGTIYAASAQLVSSAPQGKGVDVIGPDVVEPNVAAEASARVEATGALLQGRVEPDLAQGGGDVTSCTFEYVSEAQFDEHGYAGAAGAECEAAKPLPYAEPESVFAAVALAPSSTYHYRVDAADAAFPKEANDGEGEAMPEETVTTSGPPGVLAASATALTGDATLTARIDTFGFSTTCEAQLVDEAEFAASGYATARTLACPHALEAGFSPESASVEISGLSVGTTYHYRFVASNKEGSSTGADETFETFGLRSFALETLDAEGHPYTQAGGVPYVMRTSFALGTNGGLAQATVRDTETRLPPGLIGNPTAVARCTREQLTEFTCPGSAQVGVVTLDLGESTPFEEEPLYNLVAPQGVPAEFGVRFNSYTNLYIDSNVRTGGDYGVTARVSSASPAAGVIGATVELWGVPAAASHDAQRRCPSSKHLFEEGPCSAGVLAPAPFLREPTSCGGELSASMSVDTWQDPGAFVSRTAAMPAITGCESLTFGPSISIAPTEALAGSATGLDTEVTMPDAESSAGFTESALKDTTVTLPAGLSLSPSAANGLQACPQEVFAPHDAEKPSCPEASKIGTVLIHTPLLADPLEGSVYVAEQDNNPFGSVLAIYLAAEGDGALVKLAGQVSTNPQTGQLTTTFSETPQLPFSSLKLDLWSGPRATLVTPEACGSYTSEASFEAWASVAPLSASSPFQITAGCSPGFSPSFTAGTTSSDAGSYAPFVLSFSRSDGEQEPSGLTVSLPPGLLANIASVPECPEAQAAAGDCPEASRVGSVQTTAGPGSDPLIDTGSAYLTGPYKGGPFGIAVEVPAIAGPFNLGTVVVRSAIHVDPTDAHVTVVSDAFPSIIDATGGDGQSDGFPVHLRSVTVTIDRPGFTLNPTSCNPMAVTGQLTSTKGATAPVESRFQVGGCQSLPFHPTLEAFTQGQASKADGASLTVKVSSQGLGVANIAKTKLTLPLALPSRESTIEHACLDSVFESTPADPGSACDEGSQIGEAIARTPILSSPLSGPGYLVSHGGAAFPDVEFVLKGEGILLVLDGKTEIKNGITTSEFNAVPDAPVESFEAILPAGPHSAFATNIPETKHYDLCGETLTMPTVITGQNGAVIEQDTKIAITGCSGVLGAKAAQPAKPTRAQLLAKALRTCRKDKKKSKRVACEKRARKKYGARTVKKKSRKR